MSKTDSHKPKSRTKPIQKKASAMKPDTKLSPRKQAALNLEAAKPGTKGKKVKSSDEATVRIEKMHKAILSVLDEGKAIDVVSIPLAGKSAIADYMIIASGNSTRQVTALGENLCKMLKQQFGMIASVEGLPHADWVLLDALDLVIHLFKPEVRAFYALEKMWSVTPDTTVTMDVESLTEA